MRFRSYIFEFFGEKIEIDADVRTASRDAAVRMISFSVDVIIFFDLIRILS